MKTGIPNFSFRNSNRARTFFMRREWPCRTVSRIAGSSGSKPYPSTWYLPSSSLQENSTPGMKRGSPSVRIPRMIPPAFTASWSVTENRPIPASLTRARISSGASVPSETVVCICRSILLKQLVMPSLPCYSVFFSVRMFWPSR